MYGGGNNNRRRDSNDTQISKKQKLILNTEEQLESKLGFDLFTEGDKRLGWLLTFASSSWEDRETHKVYSCVDLYFVCQDGSTFKAKYKFRPYFYAATKGKKEMDVEAYLRRRYEGQIADIEIVDKEDLALKNHLSGLHKRYLKISFDTVQQLMNVKNDLIRVVERNKAKLDAEDAYESILTEKSKRRPEDFIDCINDLREFDVPYHVRFAIDNDVRCGQWYDVSLSSTGFALERRSDLLQRAEVHVCAFDIETTKQTLKFPNAEYDLIMMISYMIDGQGYLIINRECVGEDIEDLEYTPKPEYEGCFKVTNVKDEKGLIKLWFEHMQEAKPGIYVTYNGDFFDWPFLETRAAHHGYDMNNELGFRCDKIQGECRAKFACHLDYFAWVKRDSYLPQGSQGLKAVTKAKLGYDPLEVDPEDMVLFAMEKPQMMASYSVSDAVATYYLYMTYVHPFIFSLATIIPMPPDEVLRKGSGTLCEMLLMVQAYNANVICPNKHQSDPEKFHNNHLLESETYIGGNVECQESGVFRSDLPASFKLDPAAFEQLIDNLDRDLQYAIMVEGKMELESVSNYDDVKSAILEKAHTNLCSEKNNDTVNKGLVQSLSSGPNESQTESVLACPFIDEAAQLKECESTVPFQLLEVKHAVLVGDEHQLPATVESSVCKSGAPRASRRASERLSPETHLGVRRSAKTIKIEPTPRLTPSPFQTLVESIVSDEAGFARSLFGKDADSDSTGTTNVAYMNATCAFTFVDSRGTDEYDHSIILDRSHKYMQLEDILPNLVATRCGSSQVCTQLEKEIRKRVEAGGDPRIEAISDFAFNYLLGRVNATQVTDEEKERSRKTTTIMATVDIEGPKIILVNARNAGPIKYGVGDYATCGSGGTYARKMLQYSTLQNMTDAECIILGRCAMTYSNQMDPHTGGTTCGCHIQQDGSVHPFYANPLRDYLENFDAIKRLEDRIYTQETGYYDNPENYKNSTILVLHHQPLTRELALDYIRFLADAEIRRVQSWGILGDTSLELSSVTFTGDSARACSRADYIFEEARANRAEYEANRRQVKPKHLMNPHFKMQWLYHKPTNQYILVGRAADVALREKLLYRLT
ncbi:hypothetical protein OROHE_014381 [Orobanche hederae]